MADLLTQLVYDGFNNRKPSAAQLKRKRAEELASFIDGAVEKTQPGEMLISYHLSHHVPYNIASQYTEKGLLLAISTCLRHKVRKGFLDGHQGGYTKRKRRRMFTPTNKLTKKEATAALYEHVDNCLRKGRMELNEIEEDAPKNLAESYVSRHAFRMGINEVRRRIFNFDTGKHLKDRYPNG